MLTEKETTKDPEQFILLFVPKTFDGPSRNTADGPGAWYIGMYDDIYKGYLPVIHFCGHLVFDDMHRVLENLRAKSSTKIG